VTHTKRTAGRVPRRLPVPAYWLIAKNENDRMEVLTFDCGSEEALPVFSFEEEAEMFLGLGGLGCSWRVRESWAGELVSVLYGPCAGVKEVALDPLPEMVAERTVGLVRLDRERFIDDITTGRRPLRLCEPGRGPSLREGEWTGGARRAGSLPPR
jgi:hypothetical protein